MSGSQQLLIAGNLSFVAALMHVAIVFGGPNWYRWFGAGDKMALMAEQGSLFPTVVTLGIAAVLAICGLYALSGANIIFRLPFLQTALCLITFVYLFRGVAGLVLPFISSHPAIAQNTITFWIVSSLVCCVFGAFHLFGTINSWSHLATRGI